MALNLKLPKLDSLLAWVMAVFIAIVIAVIVYVTGSVAVSRKLADEEKIAQHAEHALAQFKRESAKAPESTQLAPADPHFDKGESWGYEGDLAPWRWGDLKNKWKLCSTGKRQSPIDIGSTTLDPALKSLKFHFKHDVNDLRIENSTMTVRVPSGSWMEFDSERFELETVFFRTPSEHRINGMPYDLEAQLVFKEASGLKAHLAVLFDGRSNQGAKASQALLKRLLDEGPRFSGDEAKIERINWSDLMPTTNRTYFLYKGSLTHPPCTEDVSWLVMTEPVRISRTLIEHFEKLQKSNARPVVPSKNPRLVRRSNR